MRAVVQRVRQARVRVDGKTTGEIGQGILVLLGVRGTDIDRDAVWLARKCADLRIFENADGKFDGSIIDVKGGVLVVSQFTLYGDCRRGRRPSFTDAAEPEHARALYERFVDCLEATGLDVQTGVFAARMLVEIQNDGPVTLILDSEGT